MLVGEFRGKFEGFGCWFVSLGEDWEVVVEFRGKFGGFGCWSVSLGEDLEV